MPPTNLKTELSNLRRESNAVAKMIDAHDVVSKQQAAQIKKLLSQIITTLKSLDDAKADKA